MPFIILTYALCYERLVSMFLGNIRSLSIFYKSNPLLFLELGLLGLLIMALPSLEAPKNIFLVFYLMVAMMRQIKTKELHFWQFWDWVFLIFVGSAFLSSLFTGWPEYNPWSGFVSLLSYAGLGWVVSRSNYSKEMVFWLFTLLILSVLFPLFFGLYQLELSQKSLLELHSVGHVNHSAIYLGIIYGASFSFSLAFFHARDLKFKIGLIFLLALLSYSLVIGQSRAVFCIGFVLSVLLITLVVRGKISRMFWGGFLFVFLVVVYLNEPIFLQKHRNSLLDNHYLLNRYKVWNVSTEAARWYPFFGIGINHWKYIKSQSIQTSVEARDEVYHSDNYFYPGHSHNLYLTVLVERGIVGLLGLIVFMSAWAVSLIRTLPLMRNGTQAYLWGGSFSAWIFTFGVGLVNTTLHHEHGMLTCLFLGLYLTYVCQLESENI